MGEFLGMIAGGAVAMLLSGWLMAWLLRKLAGINHRLSCVLGVSIMTLVGAWSITFEGSATFLENWILYVFCGAVALPVLVHLQRRNDATSPTEAGTL